jgi:uncharacterized circularly permuted ATP-grasp superfamily protein
VKSTAPGHIRAMETQARTPYVPTSFDEALDSEGKLREAYAELLPALAELDLEPIHQRIRQHLKDREVYFRSSEGAEEFFLDPVPRLVTQTEWELIESGLRQRARALNAFVIDAYSGQEIVREGKIPARVIETAEYFEPEMVGVEMPERPAAVIGFDVVRTREGGFAVLEDNCRTPSGLAFTTAAREAIDSFLPLDPPGEILDPTDLFELLARALRQAAPDGVGDGDPSIGLLTDGPENSGWFDHQELAERLGIPLVLEDRFEVRNARAYLRTEEGERRELQVIYRRTDDEGLRHPDGTPTWLHEALLEPVRHGNLNVVSALGAGVADDKLSHAYVEQMIRFYLGEDPILPGLRSYDLAIPQVCEEVLDRIEEMVVKPRAQLGGEGIVIAADEDTGELDTTAAQVLEHPEDFVAQQKEMLSTHPTYREGSLQPRHVDLRAFALGDEIAPTGLTRVALNEGSLIVNSSQGGGGKDTWILG